MQHRKSKPTVKQPDASWAAALRYEMVSSGRPPGDGWRTFQEIAASEGLSETTARRACRVALAAGRLEEARGRIGPLNHQARFFRPVKRG